jgi:1-acyl-sn-glycerol-3-phosphate acyltransferase
MSSLIVNALAAAREWAPFVACFWLATCTTAWVLCRLRVLPVVLMRAWFIYVFIGNVIAIRVGTDLVTFIANRFFGVSLDETPRYAAHVCSTLFWLQTALCPHIQVLTPDAKTTELYAKLPPRALICLNHTSFYDAFFFVGHTPRDIIITCRTLIKESLRSQPIFGQVYDNCGHFPVFFKSDASFSVDAEKQQAVTDKMKWFVTERQGRLSMFPEGQLNKNPAQLQPFRFGSIKLALDHQMPIYLLALWGAHETWPVGAPIGGLPADISYCLREFVYDPAKDPLEEMAKRMQTEMQVMVDNLRAAAEKKKLK